MSCGVYTFGGDSIEYRVRGESQRHRRSSSSWVGPSLTRLRSN